MHTTTQVPSTRKKNYINNSDFYDALVEYQRILADALEKGLEKPRVSEYLGECFLLLSKNIGYKYQFINYTFKDELISTGVVNCLLYMHNFNPEKSKNPFAYFTQIIYNSYIRYIMSEYNHRNIVCELICESDVDSLYNDEDIDADYVSGLIKIKNEYLMNRKPIKKKEKKIKYHENSLC